MRAKTFLRVTVVFLLTFAFAAASLAGDEKAGSTAFKFLSIGVGSRLVSMGNAGIAIVNDATSMYWNPAGMAGTTRGTVTFAYTDYLLDVKHFYVGAAYHFNGIGVLGVNVIGLNFGDIKETLADGNLTGNTISSDHLAIGVSYARKFSGEFSAGGTVKYIREKLDTESASGVAFDFGTQFSTGWRNLRIGAQLSNFGFDVKFLEEKHKLPLTFRVGFAIDSRGFIESDNHLVTLAVDVLSQNDKDQLVPVGAEYRYSKLFSLRGGYTLNYDEANFSFGGGLHLGSLSIDYAFSDLEFFDSVNRFSIGFEF